MKKEDLTYKIEQLEEQIKDTTEFTNLFWRRELKKWYKTDWKLSCPSYGEIVEKIIKNREEFVKKANEILQKYKKELSNF